MSDMCIVGAPKVLGDTACSGVIPSALHCKHGHVQTGACSPRERVCGHGWYPDFAPTCCNEELAERLAPRFGGHP